MYVLCVWSVVVVLVGVGVAVPAQEKRIHRQAELSERDHDDATHQYDHEAFLGKEEAKTFDQLSPQESQAKLGKIVERIDTDKDGYVSHGELHQWIKHRQRRYVEENVDKHYKDYDQNKDGNIGWEEYKNVTYGYYLDEEDDSYLDDKATYRTMLKRDERRFQAADRNRDGIATRDEFTAFIHPEKFDYMRDIVVQETVEDIDKNGDGKIDLDEYIGDMFVPEAGESEPDWVTNEKRHFSEFRDVNKDGVLDGKEVAEWILPGEVDHADNEATHLIHETDTDRDQKITKKEILANWNMFVGSQATNYGEDLTKRHDEL